MGFQKFMDRIIGILEVCELAHVGWAGFATGGRQALGDPVIAERAFVRDFLDRMDVAASCSTAVNAG